MPFNDHQEFKDASFSFLCFCVFSFSFFNLETLVVLFLIQILVTLKPHSVKTTIISNKINMPDQQNVLMPTSWCPETQELFTPVAFLGEGGFGSVWLAKKPKDNSPSLSL